MSTEQVIDDARRLGLVFLGDHHVDQALHRRYRDLLEALAARGTKLVLALEAIGTQDEADVAAYLAGTLDAEPLAARIRTRWPDSWLDNVEVDGAFYRDLLEFARRTATPVAGLEPTPRLPLVLRDEGIAERIRGLRTGIASDRVLVVVVGHSHLFGVGELVDRVGAAAVVVGARLSNTLRDRAAAAGPFPDGFRRTDRGVLFPPEAR